MNKYNVIKNCSTYEYFKELWRFEAKYLTNYVVETVFWPLNVLWVSVV